MAVLWFGGSDVSKYRLTVMVLPEEQCSSVSNDAAGWAKLVEQLRGSSIAAIGIEASGGYERGVMRALLAAGVPVRHVNPFKLRQFARASGVLAKNDPLDARLIASSGTSPRNSSSRLAVSSLATKLIPVRLPSGRARLLTNPTRTGSAPLTKTIGIVPVAALAAAPARHFVTAYRVGEDQASMRCGISTWPMTGSGL